ncbi:uncharacterized protein B0T15DRAFT_513894 [Chaetomium strumarium]|uniref:Uncharacterized protein n=1 Tax=Chaetomium strumarium TaxID=1170767 RepID=A0AAJ0LZU1_9PEZI|nr:hypothetical protein B0T15DRAFT_513894 [Chaetomium strumarium]
MAFVRDLNVGGFFRRYFSFKTLRAVRVFQSSHSHFYKERGLKTSNQYTPSSRPTTGLRVPRLRRKDRRHALGFVEGWNTNRIAISGSVPCLASCLVGAIGSAMGGDPQTAFTVASFILTSSSILLALLAISSSIESSGGLSR